MSLWKDIIMWHTSTDLGNYNTWGTWLYPQSTNQPTNFQIWNRLKQAEKLRNLDQVSSFWTKHPTLNQPNMKGEVGIFKDIYSILGPLDIPIPVIWLLFPSFLPTMTSGNWHVNDMVFRFTSLYIVEKKTSFEENFLCDKWYGIRSLRALLIKWKTDLGKIETTRVDKNSYFLTDSVE